MIRARMPAADLTNAYLKDANLYDAHLKRANLSAACLEGANLERAQLDQATYTDSTIWPEGFDPKAAGAILVDEDGYPVEEPDKEAS